MELWCCHVVMIVRCGSSWQLARTACDARGRHRLVTFVVVTLGLVYLTTWS